MVSRDETLRKLTILADDFSRQNGIVNVEDEDVCSRVVDSFLRFLKGAGISDYVVERKIRRERDRDHIMAVLAGAHQAHSAFFTAFNNTYGSVKFERHFFAS